MSTYVIVNRAPAGYRGSRESLAEWNAWFDELGVGLLDRGNHTPMAIRTDWRRDSMG